MSLYTHSSNGKSPSNHKVLTSLNSLPELKLTKIKLLKTEATTITQKSLFTSSWFLPLGVSENYHDHLPTHWNQEIDTTFSHELVRKKKSMNEIVSNQKKTKELLLKSIYGPKWHSSVGWVPFPPAERLLVQLLVMVHSCFAGHIPGWGVRSNYSDRCFSTSLPPSL